MSSWPTLARRSCASSSFLIAVGLMWLAGNVNKADATTTTSTSTTTSTTSSSTTSTSSTTTTTAPIVSYLKCYRMKDPVRLRGPLPAWLKLEGPEAPGENCRIVGGYRLLCLPVSKELTVDQSEITVVGSDSPFPPGFATLGEREIDQDRICYKIKCESSASPVGPSDEFTDQFATRSVSKLKPFLLCGAAVRNRCGNGIREGLEACDDGNTADDDCCAGDCSAITADDGDMPSGCVDTDPEIGNSDRPCTVPACGDVDAAGIACIKPEADCSGGPANFTCVQDYFLPDDTVACPPPPKSPDGDNNPCTQPRCDGTGLCDQAGFLEPATTSCEETPDPDPCSVALCDGAGTCEQAAEPEAAGTPCPDPGAFPCRKGQCDGAGVCEETVLVATGTVCPDDGTNDCFDARCDEVGNCDQEFFARNCVVGEICCPQDGTCVPESPGCP